MPRPLSGTQDDGVTSSSGQPAPPGRGPVVALLVFTALLLAPLAYGLYYVGHEAVAACMGPTGCRDRASAASLVNAALLLVAGPACGALLGGLGGAALRRRAAVWAAAGALLGAAGVWVAAVVWLDHSLQHSDWQF
jgi:hypothetical protein